MAASSTLTCSFLAFSMVEDILVASVVTWPSAFFKLGMYAVATPWLVNASKADSTFIDSIFSDAIFWFQNEQASSIPVGFISSVVSERLLAVESVTFWL